MRTFRLYLLLSTFTLLLAGWSACNAEQSNYKQSPEDMHSLVITFSTPSHHKVNLANQLGNMILSILKAQPENIAQQINASGSGWALTSNLSGVQLALFTSNHPWEIGAHALNILNKLSTRANEIRNVTHNSSEYQVILTTHSTEPSTFKPVTFDLSESLQEYLPHLETSAKSLETMYYLQNDLISLQTQNQPIMAKIVHWPTLGLKSFFSAKFIGEQFLEFFSQPEELSYEIVYSPSGIYLLLLTTGSESVLFKNFAPVNRFTTKISELAKAHWSKFADKSAAILNEDYRDFRKTILTRAWLKHFNQAKKHSKQPKTDLGFVNPSSIREHYAVPESFMLSFSRSQNQSPRIITTRHQENSTGIDVTLMLQGNDHVIDKIIKKLDTLLEESFAFSTRQPASETLFIHFYNTPENANILLRTFHETINTSALASESLDIAIASAGNLPPFVLKGLIESSWPGKKSPHDWSEANQQSIARITGFDENNTTALHYRWKLLTATPRGKTSLLAKLAISDCYINSFALPLSKE